MARVLIVGCGCRGQALAAALVGDGHAVRGTTRAERGRAPIEAAGAEPVVADPDRLGTLLPALPGVSAICWLLGSADGGAEAAAALHGPRLSSLLEKLVDTTVRGVVYEAAGSVAPDLLREGAAIVKRAAATYNMPARVVDSDPADRPEWLAAMRGAVAEILGG